MALSNLGPLRSADLDIADLTLLTGENNAGKTFFATVLHRVLDASPSSSPLPLRAMDRAPTQVREWVARVLDGPDDDADSTDTWEFDPSEESSEWAAQLATEMLQSYGRVVRESISYAFGAEPGDLRRRTRSRRAADCFLRIRAHEPAWELEIRFDNHDVHVTPPDSREWLATALDPQRIQEGIRIRPYMRRDTARSVETAVRRYRFPFAPSMQSALFSAWPSHAIHLPADRTGVMQSHKVLAGGAARQSAIAGIKPIQIETLSGTSADFLAIVLEILEMMPSRRNPRKKLNSLVGDFEQHLRASIEVDQRGDGMEAIVARTPEGSFPMSRASSMLTELAPLLLVLKAPHLDIDQLTIDEPEAHLHPGMQVRVASFIAELVLLGIRVTVTTHSDFFVSHLKNMVRLHSLKEAGCEPRATGIPAVAPSRVGSLHFRRENGWCIARGPDSDGVEGIDESSFTQVMRAQYKTTADLISDLSEVSRVTR